MLKKFITGAVFLAWGLVSAAAQSNDRLDELLAQAQARLDTTAYLLLVSGGQLPETSDPAAAFDAATASGWLKNRHPEDPVSLEDLAFLIMKSQKLSGGLEWMFLPSPRAAYRELAYRNVLNVSAGPRRLVAGDEVIRALSAAAVLKGGRP